MLLRILEATDTTGSTFQVDGGRYQILVVDWAATVNLEIQNPDDDTDWIETSETWSAVGVKGMWLGAGGTYRLSTATAGAKAWVMDLHQNDIGGDRA